MVRRQFILQKTWLKNQEKSMQKQTHLCFEWRLNNKDSSVFKLSNNQFVMADKWLFYNDSSIVNDFSKQVWLETVLSFIIVLWSTRIKVYFSSLYQELARYVYFCWRSWILTYQADGLDYRIIFPMMIIVFRKYKSCHLANYQNEQLFIYVETIIYR